MSTLDTVGNIHRPAGSAGGTGGQFAGRHNTAPAGILGEPAAPEHSLARRFGSVEEKVKAMQEELAAAVDALADDESWNRYLDTISRFHRYSFQNQLLISTQRPDATRVAGFKTWIGVGRAVRKGEKGISILAPRLINIRDDAGAPELDETGRPKKKIIGFTSATVFDVAQTDGDELPEIVRDLTEEPPAGYVDDLEAAIVKQGYSVSYEKIPDGAKGYTTVNGSKRVVIDEALTPGSRATVLAHELGHIVCGHTNGERSGEYHTGHGGKRGEMEVEAESFAYTLSKINGMQAHQRGASEYVASWQQYEPDAIRKVGETLSRAVKATIDGGTWRNAIDG